MAEEKQEHKSYKRYLGDGVYAEFDGAHIVLSTDGDMMCYNNTIYLSGKVSSSLVAMIDEIGDKL